MYVARNNEGEIYGAWTVPQTAEQREQGHSHPSWLPDDDADVVAFNSRIPSEPTPEQRLASLGFTPEQLKALLGLE